MKFKTIFKLLNYKNLWSLFLLCIKHPLFVIPTLFATRACIHYANANFGALHHRNNVTNAFRHALWNILIIRRCKRYTHDVNKAVRWASVITSWHEEFSPNNDVARKMDLHNNYCGQEFFKANPELNVADFISLLKTAMKSAVKVSEIADIETQRTTLVYLEKIAKDPHA